MKQRKHINLVIAALIASAAVSAQTISILDNELDQRALGLPVEIKGQQTHMGPGKVTWWMVTLILPSEHYSKANLERIFQYYSEKYSNKKDILRVSVFADEETYNRDRDSWDPRRKNALTEEELLSLPAKQRKTTPHATYERLCYNEFYYYSPDLEDVDRRETVVLKGKSQTLTVIPPDCN